MKKWQKKLCSIQDMLMKLETSIDYLEENDVNRAFVRFAVRYEHFRRSFSKVNSQLSYYVRLLGFTSIFYTCGIMYMTFFGTNPMMKAFSSIMNFLLTGRLLLVQMTSAKITSVNDHIYRMLTRLQARGNLKTHYKVTMYKIIQQVGFLGKPSLALEASSDGSAFVSMSIFSYIEKVALFFLPLVTFMNGIANRSLEQ